MESPAHNSYSELVTRAYVSVVRWGFARFYREFAWTYDIVAALVSGGHWADWGRAALPYLDGQTLELGCGTGNLQRACARAGWPVFGLDASPHMLKLTRHKLRTAGLPLRLARGVAQALPFAPATFDTLVATFPTEYIIHPATLDELWRVLRPGGRVVIVLAASFGSDGAYQRAIDLLYRATLQRSPRSAASLPLDSTAGRALRAYGFVVDEQWLPVGAHAVHLVLAGRNG